MAVNHRKIEKMTQEDRDQRINELHQKAMNMWPKLENLIDELKCLGPHSFDGDNALLNTREWLEQLSKR